MNIFLFGLKKCGKTYFGMKLAQKLHREFIESDHMIEEIYAAQYHDSLSYREIAKKHGFDFFRELERHAVSLLVQKRHSVVSLGGGVVLDPENIIRLKEVGMLIYLKGSKAELKAKILSGEIPQYLDPHNPGESFEKLYDERNPLYEQVATHQVVMTHKDEHEILEELYKMTKKT